jgi:hypothetical protein
VRYKMDTSENTTLASGRKYGGIYCAAVGCHNSTYRDGPRGIKFHSFPKNSERRQRWIQRVKREDWTPSSCKIILLATFLSHVLNDLFYVLQALGFVQSTSLTARVTTQTVRILSRQNSQQRMWCPRTRRTRTD